jgi:large subunit ribosomal protein L24
MNTKIKIGDKVAIIKGKDQGKTGLVKKIYISSNKALVESINMVKKHVKTKGNQQGGIFDIEKPIALSNTQLVCPSCKKRTRIAIEIKDGKKQRICKKCGAVIESKKESTPVKAKKSASKEIKSKK